MCGIAGHISFASCATPLDLAALCHRGPDAQGEWWSPDRRVWLGHTRLAILDLSDAGAQPMVHPETGDVIVYNGETYNHLDLRRDLEAAGHRFRGTSDTETILTGFAQWGPEVFAKLSGMFALAIYSPSRRITYLARGRFGIKPLYVRYSSGESIAFCSEVRPLTRPGGLRVTRESVAEFYQRGCCPHANLLAPDITEVPVGSYIAVTAAGPEPAVTYWPPLRFAKPPSSDAGRPAVVAEIRRLLEHSVEAHLISDVPVAAFLSGGIDSSAIVALASKHLGKNLHTFSVGFPGSANDESTISREVASKFGTSHHHIVLDESEIIAAIREGVAAFDLPSLDAMNTFIVCRAVARAGFKVALSGLGGDELFGGYHYFREIPRLKWLALFPKPFLAIPRLWGKGSHLLGDVPSTPDAVVFTVWRRRMIPGDLLRANNMAAPPLPDEPRPELPDDFAAISWSELNHYMRDMLLRDTDQMSMAHSVEVRVPLLDNALVDFVLGLPSKAKLETPPRLADVSKPLLVESVIDLLPEAVYRRKKQGFAIPMDAWMRGPLADFVEEGLDAATARGALEAAFAATLREGFAARTTRWEYLWIPCVLGHYLEKWHASCPPPLTARPQRC